MFSHVLHGIEEATAILAQAEITRKDVGPLLEMSQGHRALTHWDERKGTNVTSAVLETGEPLEVDTGYDPIRLQNTTQVRETYETLWDVEMAWSDLVVGAKPPKRSSSWSFLRNNPDAQAEHHELAVFYIGKLIVFYETAVSRGHSVLAACT